jgi:hypothetical protein
MNARYFLPSVGRFISADSIVPNPTNPQSYNRYSYVLNSPINYTDPTGHRECDLENLDCDNPEPLNLPAWWTNDERDHVYIEGYGYFDEGHIARGYTLGIYIMGQLMAGEKEFTLRSGEDYRVTYKIGDDIDLANLTREEMVSLAYAIFTDFEIEYETFQGTQTGISSLSSFAPEDLPSDYIGFWAAVNGYSFNDIPGILQRLGTVEPRSTLGVIQVNTITIPCGGPLPGKVTMVAQNFEFAPMTTVISNGPLSVQQTWENVPWPEWLQLPKGLYEVQE